MVLICSSHFINPIVHVATGAVYMTGGCIHKGVHLIVKYMHSNNLSLIYICAFYSLSCDVYEFSASMTYRLLVALFLAMIPA